MGEPFESSAKEKAAKIRCKPENRHLRVRDVAVIGRHDRHSHQDHAKGVEHIQRAKDTSAREDTTLESIHAKIANAQDFSRIPVRDTARRHPTQMMATTEFAGYTHSRTVPTTIRRDVVQRGFFGSAWDVTKAVGRGIYSVGEDLVGGAARTGRGLNVFNTGELAKIGDENERAYQLLKSLVSNRETLYQFATILVENIYANLTADKKSAVNSVVAKTAAVGVGYAAGRLVIGKTLATKLAQRIVTVIVATQGYKMLAKKLGTSAAASSTGIGIPIGLLMLQGVVERASQASRRLASQDPDLYRVLHAQGMDMAWFLVEPQFDQLREMVMQELASSSQTQDEQMSHAPTSELDD